MDIWNPNMGLCISLSPGHPRKISMESAPDANECPVVCAKRDHQKWPTCDNHPPRSKKHCNTYRKRLTVHSNHLATTLFQGLPCNRRLKRHYPEDLVTRFNYYYVQPPSVKNRSLEIEPKKEMPHWRNLLHDIHTDWHTRVLNVLVQLALDWRIK